MMDMAYLGWSRYFFLAVFAAYAYLDVWFDVSSRKGLTTLFSSRG